MPNITFYLKLTVDDQEFEYALTEEATENEMLSSERPQLFFDSLCRQVEKRVNTKKLNHRLSEISIDDKVSEPYLKKRQAKNC
ncbi:hypothetical protein BKK47_07535 [Rodentibacter mrazii]|uniref:Uncharacterized protein n=1 Tax=Rodentibacter mrazii TaxID=1908257 RepID=A0A1V3IEV5_9PAST|nr:hypothetical protein [Rodentibacter mrazii]OOF39061.1 hypothetical protein BKK47_07535 [Rodentibacter mrazii]